MKRFLLVLTILSVITVTWWGLCDAIPFSGSGFDVDFFDSGTNVPQEYLTLSGEGNYYESVYSQKVVFDDTPSSITLAELTIRHKDNSYSNGSNEAWYINYTGLDSYLLENSNKDWIEETFTVTDLFNGISGPEWTINLKFFETTNGTDGLTIDSILLTGEYIPVTQEDPQPTQDNHAPEPATLLLLGLGIMGFAVISRKKRHTKIR